MSLVIVKTEVGNFGSVQNMCRRVGANPVVSSDPEVVEGAKKLLFPGVGSFDPAVEYLDRTGLREALNRQFAAETPVLAICLGMQLLLDRSEEGTLPGLGWIPGDVRHLRKVRGEDLRVPHMGWAPVSPAIDHPLFDEAQVDARYYFVHSYAAVPENDCHILATADYGGPFVSAVAAGNVTGVQFHPEKSHRHGKALIARFVEDG